jgi:hypothetical protein
MCGLTICMIQLADFLLACTPDKLTYVANLSSTGEYSGYLHCYMNPIVTIRINEDHELSKLT